MTGIIIRNVSPDLHAALRTRAAEANSSLAAVIVEILRDVLLDDSDQITVGFIPLINGELGSDYTCPDCGNTVGEIPLFIPVVGVKNPKFAQPVCKFCATTD